MARLSAWRSMMRQQLTVAAPTGLSGYGDMVYSTSPVTYRCRLVGKRKQVLNAQGQEVTSMWTAYLYSADVIDPQSQVTLSTGDVGSTATLAIRPPIKATGLFPDEHGHHHSVIYL